jgi:hypothetical protein
MIWLIGIAIYLVIGIGILIWCVTTDPYGGFVLEFWWLVVFFYPLLIINSMYRGIFRK